MAGADTAIAADTVIAAATRVADMPVEYAVMRAAPAATQLREAA
jgi:hypothetical protein